MKRAILTLFFLILLAQGIVAQAEDSYSKYKSLDLNFKLESHVTITQTDANKKVEFIKTDLSLFPRNDFSQNVINIEILSTPEADISKTEEYISYKWRTVKQDKLEFSLDSKVKTKNTISKIRKTSKFPIKTVDTGLLKYTHPSDFIDLTPEIESKANEIIGGETDFYKVVFKLADWTKTNIKYDLNTMTSEAVQKSSWVLKSRNGVCDEMTNLFISFLRSIGIPARFVSGMVYSNIGSGWGPHGWAEVYFPENGWIPFDVTFGQYGWLDPSHIKLKNSLDSGGASLEYSWRATGVKVEPAEITLEATLISAGKKIESPFLISIKPLSQNVGFGSYVPILVNIENKENYYASSQIIIKKAPNLTENNVKEVLLAPGESKILAWIVYIPPNLEKDYIYTAVLEAATSFGDIASSKVNYAAEYPLHSLRNAEKLLYDLEKKEEKEKTSTLDISCIPDQEIYYSNETAKISCTITNKDSKELSVKTCLRDSCKSIKIKPSEKQIIELETDLQTSGRIPITAEDENGIIYSYVTLNKIETSEIYVTDINPKSVHYKDEMTLVFNVNSDTEVKDLILHFSFGQLRLEDFKGSKQIAIDTNGKALIKPVKFKASYIDQKGEEKIQEIEFKVEVVSIPIYVKIIYWILDVF